MMAGDNELGRAAAKLLADVRRSWVETVDSSWVEANRRHRLGVAHGITGTILAVARAAEATGDSDLTDWLGELVDAENERIARRDGIPGRVTTDSRRLPDTTWCWGVAGYGATRPHVARVLEGESALRYASRAKEILSAAVSTTGTDRLCCGAASWLNTLDGEAGEVLADDLAARLGSLKLEDGTTYQSTSLFRGTAGVGYQLLRRLDPSLPDVLAFAPAAPR